MEEFVPIQTLDLAVAPHADGSIRAVVTLSWPYSSSTKQCAFLLADPDARLRSRKGQVRVRFTGASAEAVAKARVGISDEIVLRLEGATWAGGQDGGGMVTRTPGRGVEGELVYGNRLRLTVARTGGGNVEHVDVDAPPSAPLRSMDGVVEDVPALTRATPRAGSGLRESLVGGVGGVPIYSSPAFAKRLRLSGEYFLDSAYDPFMDGANEVRAESKLRSSFGGVGQWRYAQRTPSPVKDVFEPDSPRGHQQQTASPESHAEDVMMQDGKPEDDAETTVPDGPPTPEDEEQPVNWTVPTVADHTRERANSPHERFATIGDMPEIQEQAAQIFAEMPPPPLLPRLQTSVTQSVVSPDQGARQPNTERQQSPSTPKLQAVPNSALPLPSPFPSEAVQSLHGPTASASSPAELDSAVEDEAESESHALPQHGLMSGAQQRDDLEPFEPLRAFKRIRDDMRHADSHEDHHMPQTEIIPQRTTQESIPETQPKPQETQQEARELPQHPPIPRTPAKLPPSEFSLDGVTASARPPHSQSTPQSERDRVMAQTFKSLFGFQRTSPQPPVRPSVHPQEAVTPTPIFGLSDMARMRFGANVDVGEQPALARNAMEIAETQQEEYGADDETARSHAPESLGQASSPAIEDSAVQDNVENEPRQMPNNFDTRLAPSSPRLIAGVPDEPRRVVDGPFVAESAALSDLLNEPISGSTTEPNTDESQVDQDFAESTTPQPLFNPGVIAESEQPRSPAVDVVELESSSDAEQEESLSQERSDLAEYEIAHVSPGLEDEVVDVEADLSSPPATSQLDKVGDEIMHDANDEGLGRRTMAAAPATALSPWLLSSSSAPSANEHFAGGRELLSGSQRPYPNFPTERVVEDSQDEEVSATLSTQATPMADEKAGVIAVPDREPVEKPANVRKSPYQPPAHPDVEIEDTIIAKPTADEEPDAIEVSVQGPLEVSASIASSPSQPLAQTDVVMKDAVVAPTADVEPAFGEHHTFLRSTAHTAVIELGSSSPEQETALFDPEAAEQGSPAPLTQVRIGQRIDEQYDAGTPTEVDPSSPFEEVVSPSDAADTTSEAASPVSTTLQVAPAEATDVQPGLETVMETNSSSPVEPAAERTPGVKGRRAPGRPGRFDPSEPLHMTTRRRAQHPTTNSSPPAKGSLDDEDSNWRNSFDDDPPSTSAAAEVAIPSPPAPVTQIRPDALTEDRPGVEAAIEVGSSSPVEETGPFAHAAGLQPAPLATQIQIEEPVLQRDFMDDFVELDRFEGEDQAEGADTEVSEGQYATQMNESIPFETQIPVHMTPYESEEHNSPSEALQTSMDIESQRGYSTQANESLPFETQIPADVTLYESQEHAHSTEAPQTAMDTDESSREYATEVNESISFETQIQKRAQQTAMDTDESSREHDTQVNESIPFETQIQSDVTPFQSQEQPPQLAYAGQTNATSYPTLPLSPLASQPRQEPQASQTGQQSQYESVMGNLPLTPQLTQGKSDVRPVESQPEATQEPAMASAQVETYNQGLETAPTAAQEAMEDLPRHGGDGYLQQVDIDTERVPSATPVRKAPARKSLSARLSNVPDVISAWFSPKRPSGVTGQTPAQERPSSHEDINGRIASAAEAPTANGRSIPKPDSREAEVIAHVEMTRTESNGISTPMGYFTPLSRLETLLNPSSQAVYGGTNTIEVFAVVTDSTKAPERAKSGQRDYFTILRVSQASLQAGSSIRVEVFRPWKAKLPVAEVGDVVLLRAFAVKSRKRQPYLLSTDASSWCVWRFSDAKVAEDSESKPEWAKRSTSSSSGVREEVKGPPVEFGDEERQHARTLREWWVALHPEVESEHTGIEREDVEASGLVSPQLAAKL